MITSTANAKVKHLANLRKKRKLRDEEGVFLVEGIRMFRETPKRLLKEVYASESFYKKEKHMTDEALKGSGAHLLILWLCVGYEDASGNPVRGQAAGL